MLLERTPEPGPRVSDKSETELPRPCWQMHKGEVLSDFPDWKVGQQLSQLSPHVDDDGEVHTGLNPHRSGSDEAPSDQAQEILASTRWISSVAFGRTAPGCQSLSERWHHADHRS